MAVREITVIGHKALHQPTRRVKEVNDELRTLVDDMFDTMDAANGAGLAANQVGVRLRLFVYDCSRAETEPTVRGYVINPVLEIGAMRPGPAELDRDTEGCLSVPGEWFPTKRSDWARVTGTDLEGAPVVVEGTGLLARCLQHETGHLDGHLYVEVLDPSQKTAAREAIKRRGWEQARVTRWNPASQEAEDV